MVRKPPAEDVGDDGLEVSSPKHAAAGVSGVVHGLGAGLREMGVRRSARTLLRLNQVDGFACPGCGNADPRTCDVVKRTCGYLGNPQQRPMVHGRHVEISSRVKHLPRPTSLDAAVPDLCG